MPTSGLVTGFGIRRTWIATPQATPVWVEIPKVTAANFKATVTEVEQTGNDVIVDQWYVGQKGSITVKASQASLAVFAQLSGTTATSFASYQQLSFGLNAELVPPVVAVRGLVIGKDDTLAKVHLIIYWYKCHVKTVFETFPDSAYGKLNEATLNFIALKSSTDETATALASQAIGRVEVWVATASPLSAYE